MLILNFSVALTEYQTSFVSFLGTHKLDTITCTTAAKFVGEAASAIRSLHREEMSEVFVNAFTVSPFVCVYA